MNLPENIEQMHALSVEVSDVIYLRLQTHNLPDSAISASENCSYTSNLTDSEPPLMELFSSTQTTGLYSLTHPLCS